MYTIKGEESPYVRLQYEGLDENMPSRAMNVIRKLNKFSYRRDFRFIIHSYTDSGLIVGIRLYGLVAKTDFNIYTVIRYDSNDRDLVRSAFSLILQATHKELTQQVTFGADTIEHLLTTSAYLV